MARIEPNGDGVLLTLDAEEVRFLTGLFQDLSSRLAIDPAASDPVSRRLEPPVSRGDADIDAEVRSLFSQDLRGDRQERLRSVAATLEANTDADGLTCPVDLELALALTQALNDVRLALGALIDITALERADLERDDPRHDTLMLMDHLGWLQGQLVEFLDA
jgi:hypothetical protein